MNLKCINRGIKSEICILEDWLDVIQDKIDNYNFKEDSVLAVKTPLIHRIALKILRFKTLGSTRNGFIIGYAGSEDTSKTILLELTSRDYYSLYSKKLPRLIALPLSEPERTLIYVGVGASGVVVNVLAAEITYRALKEALGLIVNTIASATGFEVSVLSNFTLNETITFRNTGLEKTWRKILERFFKYHVASLASLACQVSMANILPFLFKTPFWLGQFTGVLLGFIVNFILGYIYTWSRHRI
jgi:putative flippase GtrA